MTLDDIQHELDQLAAGTDLKVLSADPLRYCQVWLDRGERPHIVLISVGRILFLLAERSRIQRQVDALRTEINHVSQQVGDARRKGENADELTRYASVLKQMVPLVERGVLEDALNRIKEENPCSKN